MRDLGRRIFGLAALLLGIVEFVTRDFATIWEPVPNDMPGRTAWAMTTALLFIGSGIGLQWKRTLRPAAAIIALFYFAFTCLWLPRVIGYPEIFATWGGTAEELVPCIAALVIFLETDRGSGPRRIRLLRACGIIYGLCVVAFGINHFFAMDITASMVPSWIPPSQWSWALLTGVFDVVGGAAIITGIFASAAARLLTVMYVGFGVLIWAPRLFNDPATSASWTGNAVNLSLIGAAWVLADFLQKEKGSGPIARGWRKRDLGRSSENPPLPKRGGASSS